MTSGSVADLGPFALGPCTDLAARCLARPDLGRIARFPTIAPLRPESVSRSGASAPLIRPRFRVAGPLVLSTHQTRGFGAPGGRCRHSSRADCAGSRSARDENEGVVLAEPVFETVSARFRRICPSVQTKCSPSRAFVVLREPPGAHQGRGLAGQRARRLAIRPSGGGSIGFPSGGARRPSSVRRGLAPADLGDLFDQPRAVVISIGLPNGRIFDRRARARGHDLLGLRRRRDDAALGTSGLSRATSPVTTPARRGGSPSRGRPGRG